MKKKNERKERESQQSSRLCLVGTTQSAVRATHERRLHGGRVPGAAGSIIINERPHGSRTGLGRAETTLTLATLSACLAETS
jgi:hypothetical protein